MKTFRHPYRSQRGGFIFKAIVALVALAIFCVVAWVVLLPSIVVSTVHSKTGFTVKVNHLAVNPLAGKVNITGLVVQNPDYWPEHEFLDMRGFSADVKMASLFSDRFEADEVKLDVAKLVLVRDQRGKLNASVFSDGITGAAPEGQPKGEPAKKQQFLIKRLVLKFDRMSLVDYSGGGKPVTRDYNLAVDRELKDVDSVAKILEPFTGTALALINDALGSKYKLDPSTLQNITNLLKTGGKKAEETFKGLLDSLEKKKR